MNYNNLIWKPAALSVSILLLGAVAMAQDSPLSQSATTQNSASSVSRPETSPPVSVVPDNPANSTNSEGSAIHRAAPIKPKKYFPYTVHAGDTLETVSQRFGVPVSELARTNGISEDDELGTGQELKILNPYESSQKTLEAQLQQLQAQVQVDEQKLQSAQAQVVELSSKNSELASDNESLHEATHTLPWWRGMALGVGAAALLVLGVTILTLFEWWRMRRRFIAVSDLAQAMGRLDLRYKELLGKAELRMQQLYGRRRSAAAETGIQTAAKSQEELEIERLNHDLREILQQHLEAIGAAAAPKSPLNLTRIAAPEEHPAVQPTYRR